MDVLTYYLKIVVGFKYDSNVNDQQEMETKLTVPIQLAKFAARTFVLIAIGTCQSLTSNDCCS